MLKRHEMADADSARKLVRAHFSISCLSCCLYTTLTATLSILLCPRALITPSTDRQEAAARELATARSEARAARLRQEEMEGETRMLQARVVRDLVLGVAGGTGGLWLAAHSD